MLDWLNPMMWGNYDFGAVPGQFGNPFEVAPRSLSGNRAATLSQAPAGTTTLRGSQVPRGTDQKVNPNAVMAVPPRQQLAQIMAPQQPQWPQYPYAGGPNYGSQQGSHYGGYTTSGPQRGGSGSVGGWGWGGGARSSATQGGMWGGIR